MSFYTILSKARKQFQDELSAGGVALPADSGDAERRRFMDELERQTNEKAMAREKRLAEAIESIDKGTDAIASKLHKIKAMFQEEQRDPVEFIIHRITTNPCYTLEAQREILKRLEALLKERAMPASHSSS